MDDVIKYDSFLFIPSLWTYQFQLFFADFIKLNLIAIFKGSKVTEYTVIGYFQVWLGQHSLSAAQLLVRFKSKKNFDHS